MDDDARLKKAPKIYKEDCRIDWKQPGEKVANLIRGLSPYPAAFTTLEMESGKKLQCKIFRASFEAAARGDAPGTIFTDGKTSLDVAVKDGLIHVHSLQMEGKKQMDIPDFLRGFNPGQGTFWFS